MSKQTLCCPIRISFFLKTVQSIGSIRHDFYSSEASQFSNLLKRRDVFELARIRANFSFLTITQSIATSIVNAGCSISLILALNKESCLIDPIDWTVFKNEILDWATQKSLALEFIEDTGKKFRERTTPAHNPRSRPTGRRTSSHVYNLFSVTPPRSEHTAELLSLGATPRLCTFISRINKHRPLLVGILPNQLRAILKDSTPYFEEAFEDISYTLVFHSYQIWKTRRRLMSKFWKEIAPEDWNPLLRRD